MATVVATTFFILCHGFEDPFQFSIVVFYANYNFMPNLGSLGTENVLRNQDFRQIFLKIDSFALNNPSWVESTAVNSLPTNFNPDGFFSSHEDLVPLNFFFWERQIFLSGL